MSRINDSVVLELPAKSEYVSTIRLTASSVASRLGFDIDQIEDIKVSVAEVCNLLLSRMKEDLLRYKITFELHEGELTVIFEGIDVPLRCLCENIGEEYGLYIIRALMDNVELCNDKSSIVISKKIGV